MASVEEIFSQINELKPMEIATLIKRMETEWGVTAAPAAVAVAGPAGGRGAGGPPGGEGARFVFPLSFGGKKKQRLKKVNPLKRLLFKRAKDPGGGERE